MKNRNLVITLQGFYLVMIMSMHGVPLSPETTSLVSRQENKESYRRLLLITDSDGLQKPMNGPDMSTLLMAAIAQECPIAVTVELFEQFIAAKSESIEIINGDSIYRKIISQHLDRFIANPYEPGLLQEIDRLNRKMIPVVFYQFSFLAKDWYIFDIPNTSLLLLLPKKYIARITGSPILSDIKAMQEQLGFSLEGIQLPLPAANLVTKEQINEFKEHFNLFAKNKVRDFKATYLEGLLRTTPLNDERYEYSWNFFFQGHGSAAKNMVLHLPIDEFEQMLAMLNSRVHTNFLYYVSCYAGAEQNIVKPYQKFKGIRDLNFIVANGSTTDAAVAMAVFPVLDQSTFTVENGIFTMKPLISVPDFFAFLEKEGMFGKALKAVTRAASKNIPIIRFPGTEWFSGDTIDNAVFVVGNVNNMTALIDDKNFIIKDKIALLIYPEVVARPIILQGDKPVEIIGMSSSHYLSKLVINDFGRFFSNEIRTNEAFFYNTKHMYIDTLQFPIKVSTEDVYGKREALLKVVIEDSINQKAVDVTSQFINKKGDTILLLSVLIEQESAGQLTQMDVQVAGAKRAVMYFKHGYGNHYYQGTFAAWNNCIKLEELTRDNESDAVKMNLLDRKEQFFIDQENTLKAKAMAIKKSSFFNRGSRKKS